MGVSQLKGSSYIPEGSRDDPFEEPPLPVPVQQPVDPVQEREARWKKHLKDIEARGDRYEGDKPKGKQWM
jgi:hypothetical protein